MKEIKLKVPALMTIINADFTTNVPIYYTALTSVEGNGSIEMKINNEAVSFTENQKILMGSKYEVNFIPESGYQLEKLVLNNYTINNPSSIPTMLFEYVNSDIVIEAIFGTDE